MDASTVAGGARGTPELTLAQLLRERAASAPDVRGFTFLGGADDRAAEHLTYGELDARARELAGAFAARSPAADSPRVVLCLPAGFDFLAAFFACSYAGAVAVPVRCPHPKRSPDAVSAIAADCAATSGVTTCELVPVLRAAAPGVSWWTVEELETGGAGPATTVEVAAGDLAYLQYTSGSTSTPKGVEIHHRHVAANCRELARHWSIDGQSKIFSWLPHFHDMGLVFGLLQPVWSGCPGIFMPPLVFARRPVRWLTAISEHRASHSCAPDFAFDVCSRLPEDRLQGLDLRSWRVATNGAEPVRATTVERFIRRMAPFGFRAEALCPGYGLAENTLMTTSCRPGRRPVIRTVSADALQDGAMVPTDGGPAAKTTRLTSSGPVDGVDTKVSIVDPDARTVLADGRVGEIWLSGPSVAGGYWRRPEATGEKFAARLADRPDGGPHLRTGDLGAVLDGELFVLGRMDDLIVIRGANHHPEDLEHTLESCHAALEPGGGAVFAVDRDEENRLVVVHEIRRTHLRHLDADEVIRQMVAAVSEHHELEVASVVLLRPRTLPRTHSGKKKRHACRLGFEDGSLPALASWVAPRLRRTLTFGAPPAATRRAGGEAESAGDGAGHDDPAARATDDRATSDRADEVIRWLRSYAGQRLNSRLMDERRSMPPYVALDLGNRGVLSLVAPERYGGLDLDHRGLARVLEQLAAIDLTLASFVSVNNALGIRPILRFATAARREQVLPILGAGRELAAFAMTEPGAGSNVRAIAARGRPDGDSAWRLWGTKVWSGSAAWAGYIHTFVQLEDAAGGPRGVTGFLLRQGSEGLRMGPEALTMGLRAMVQNTVFLEGVRVEADDLLGEPGQGMEVAMDTMEFGRFCLSALSLGVLKRCLQLMVRHGERRTIATGRLLANPVTLARISDLTAAASAVEALIRLVAARLDRGQTVPPELYCACKTSGPEFAWRAADHLVQQMAGRGFIETNLAPQILRDTRILRIFEGPTEPMNAFIGSRLVHRGDELAAFLGEDVGQPDLATELLDATARIVHRSAGPGSPFAADAAAARSWTYVQVGEVACYAILLAAVRAATPSPALRRAEPWLRRRFERRLAKALDGTAAEVVLLDESAARDLVAAYDDDVGRVEQTLLGEDRRIDDLVAATETGPDVERAAEPPAPAAAAAPGAPEPTDGRAQELLAWLAGWIAGELGVPRETIRAQDRFADYGFDSVTSLKLANAVERETGLELSTTLVWDYPTLAELVGALVDRGSATDDLALLARIDDLSEDQVEALLGRLSRETA